LGVAARIVIVWVLGKSPKTKPLYHTGSSNQNLDHFGLTLSNHISSLSIYRKSKRTCFL